jgi:predicted Abi (CAAX) family protease
MELDEAGIIVPYQARLQLDLLLNLDGAGEVTASVDFMMRFQEASAKEPHGGKPQRQPPAQPVNLSGRYASGSSQLDPSAEST